MLLWSLLVRPSRRLLLLLGLVDSCLGPVGRLVDDVGRVLEHRLALRTDSSEQAVHRVADSSVAADVVPVITTDREPYVVYGRLQLVYGLVNHLLGRGHGATPGLLQPPQSVVTRLIFFLGHVQSTADFWLRFGHARLESAEHSRRAPGRGPRPVERLGCLQLDAVHYAWNSVHQRRWRRYAFTTVNDTASNTITAAAAAATVFVIVPTGGCGRRIL